MFSSTPTPSRLINIDEPPLLTSGSGMPLVGISPSTTLMFTNACSTSIIVMPSARNAPKLSGARIAVRRPRQAITQKHSTTSDGAEQPGLFGDHREDEVGVRLGQVEQLLHAAHQALAEHAAGADGDQRLDDLEAVAERIGPRIHERQQAPAAIVGLHQDHVERRQRQQRRRRAGSDS